MSQTFLVDAVLTFHINYIAEGVRVGDGSVENRPGAESI